MLKHFLGRALLCVCISSAALAADAFPRVSGETLAGNPIVLPDALRGKPAVLILSFSRSAQDQCRAWAERLKQKSIPVDLFQVLELEDVPRLFRGFVKSGIRKSIPQESQNNFVLLFEGQDALKKLASFQASDDAYVLLLDVNGNVQWKEHGAVNDQKLTALGSKVPGTK